MEQPSDGEIYRKVRQYDRQGNLWYASVRGRVTETDGRDQEMLAQAEEERLALVEQEMISLVEEESPAGGRTGEA
ncbi:hypothetical protein V499_00614 [Pseudogymnoascus sp. VKM F-103]|nr:hypothetical protein V499_00614 [Pseudogymnoascus sp. VKM F-103]